MKRSAFVFLRKMGAYLGRYILRLRRGGGRAWSGRGPRGLGRMPYLDYPEHTATRSAYVFLRKLGDYLGRYILPPPPKKRVKIIDTIASTIVARSLFFMAFRDRKGTLTCRDENP